MPQTPWEQIHINFLIKLPLDNGYRSIIICMDHFSKMVVLVSLYESDAQTLASCFLAEFVSYHGLIATIVSDRDPRL